MATVVQMQDLLRTKLGQPDIDPFLLDYFMAEGRREIEIAANTYWMASFNSVSLTTSQSSYSLVASTSNGFGLTNYKAHRSLFIKDVGGANWLEVPIGSWQAALEQFPTTPTAKPQIAVIENDTIYFLPTPDAAYPIQFNHWLWTSHSTTITDTDELLTRWSQLLLWSALIVAKRFFENSPEAGIEYHELFKTQIAILRQFTNERMASPVNTMDTHTAAQVLQASGGAS